LFYLGMTVKDESLIKKKGAEHYFATSYILLFKIFKEDKLNYIFYSLLSLTIAVIYY